MSLVINKTQSQYIGAWANLLALDMFESYSNFHSNNFRKTIYVVASTGERARKFLELTAKMYADKFLVHNEAHQSSITPDYTVLVSTPHNSMLEVGFITCYGMSAGYAAVARGYPAADQIIVLDESNISEDDFKNTKCNFYVMSKSKTE